MFGPHGVPEREVDGKLDACEGECPDIVVASRQPGKLNLLRFYLGNTFTRDFHDYLLLLKVKRPEFMPTAIVLHEDKA